MAFPTFRSEWFDEYTREFQGSQDAVPEDEEGDEQTFGPGAVAELSLDEKMNIFNEMMHGDAEGSQEASPRDELRGQEDEMGTTRKKKSAKARGKARAGQSEVVDEEGSDDAFRPTTSRRTTSGLIASRKVGAEASKGRAKAERGQNLRLEDGRLIR